MSRRSAIGRSPSTIGRSWSSFSSVNGPSSSARRQSVADAGSFPRDRARQQAEPERPVRHDAGAVLPAPPDQVAVVQREHRELLLERIHVTDRLASLDERPVEVRDADGTHRAGVLELGHGTPGVLDRHARRVGPVQLVQVDHVDAQASERALASRADLLRTEARALGCRGELRRHEDLVPSPRHRPPDDPLGDPLAVDLGGVDPVHARVEPGAHRGDHGLLRLVRAPHVAAGLPRPEADHGHVRSVRSQPSRPHGRAA